MKSMLLLAISSVAFVLLHATSVEAAITFTNGKWETTFDCPEWAQGAAVSCDGLSNGGDWMCNDDQGSHADLVTTDANHAGGLGGRGLRHWQGDPWGGTNNNNGGGLNLSFPTPQKELWIRFYHRYEAGYQWAFLNYDKILYIYAANTQVIPDYKWEDQLHLAIQGGGETPKSLTGGWQSVNGGTTGDGEFHAHDIYLKMDTNQSDGVARYWIDGELLIDEGGVDYSGGDAASQQGWVYFKIGSNQHEPDNDRCMAVDYDDLVVYNTTPPNTDAAGHPFIGPIGDPPPPVDPDGGPDGSTGFDGSTGPDAGPVADGSTGLEVGPGTDGSVGADSGSADATVSPPSSDAAGGRGTAPVSQAPSEESGCGCTLAGHVRRAPLTLMPILLFLVLGRRQRRS